MIDQQQRMSIFLLATFNNIANILLDDTVQFSILNQSEEIKGSINQLIDLIDKTIDMLPPAYGGNDGN